MQKNTKSLEEGSKFVGLRLDRDTAAYYSKRAKERGTTLSDFLRNMIVQGMIAENALDIEQRMRAMIAEMQLQDSGTSRADLPDAAWLSLFTSEALLSAIVEARNVQDLYAAQDRAKAKLERLKKG